MNRHRLSAIAALAAIVLLAAAATAQQESSGAPAHLVVTVEPKHGPEVPVVNREDVMVFEGHERDSVTDWVSAQGDHAALELFILIDDAADTSLGTQLEDISKFITAQPDSTKVGVAYMQDGVARVVQELTNDHAATAKSLRLPFGIAGVNASPYFSLSDLVKKWPATDARREVLMVTDGIDRYYGSWDLNDPYLQSAIDDAGRAGIVVSAIYNPGAGHFGHSYWESYWGQMYLSELADKTGGEAYYIGFTGPAVAFKPFLDEFGRRLSNQYLLTFLTKPPKKAGWKTVRLNTEIKNVDLVSAGRVYVSPTQ